LGPGHTECSSLPQFVSKYKVFVPLSVLALRVVVQNKINFLLKNFWKLHEFYNYLQITEITVYLQKLLNVCSIVQVLNGKEATIKKALDGSTYPG
jgi:hypothetical protein